MSLARFNLFFVIDANAGLYKGEEGNVPWHSTNVGRIFRDYTRGNGRNAVIMDQKIWDSIEPEFRPLPERNNCVISTEMSQTDITTILVCRSFLDALAGYGQAQTKFEEIWVIGGKRLFEEVVQQFMYLCDKVVYVQFKEIYNCSIFFDGFETLKKAHFDVSSDSTTAEYHKVCWRVDVPHQEYNYLDLVRKVKQMGDQKPDRTGVGTISIFGDMIEYDISKRFPILTTRQMFFKNILRELLYFISGGTDAKKLDEMGVKWWNDNTSRRFLDERGLTTYDEGDMGPYWGFQMRNWGAEYPGCDNPLEPGKGIDQLRNLVDGIRKDPHSRRHVIVGWNPSDVSKIPLPLCHCLLAQFYVSSNGLYLDCVVYNRSQDLFLGHPTNVVTYSLFLTMVAHVCGLSPRNIKFFMGDVHIYKDHMDAVNRQLRRDPHPAPFLKIIHGQRVKELGDFAEENFLLEGYTSHPKITAKMAV